ncbi:NAD-dependent epimerase/dehydratase family protein [Scytonema sp. UIC 10036]|uniref:NAD-dependent epimerase/dehydratase family protein n=1 Tax=Scytonema sp. UIC 10036 TaxID=2304196 RepID=UPI0012DABF12|nr:NAD(P)-dependent oxidoreductase [Scytonema sp. UIC 10036]MUG97193.1 NAD-dependent epimerase/dehydratase family protein [Scytonema sp. UIC 10036]
MILVTGATGLLGSFVVRELQQRGQPIRILARTNSEPTIQKTNVDVVLGDLANTDSLCRAAHQVTGIIHIACTFTHPEVDIAAMETLLKCWDRGAFVFISSVDVYGYAQWIPIAENHPLNKTYSSYSYGKVSCETLLEEAARKRKRSDFSILRPPHIWGPNPRCLTKKGLWTTNIYEKVYRGEDIILPGETQEEWSQFGDAWVDARELAWVSVECLKKPLGLAANVINDHFTWHDLCTELIHITGSRSAIRHSNSGSSFFAQCWKYSGERLQQHLNFNPIYRWQDTLAEMVTLTGAFQKNSQ